MKAADILQDDFKLIDNNKLPRMQETLNNPSLTKEEFLRTTSTLINAIDSDLKSKTSKVEQPVAAGHAQRLQNIRDEKKNATEEVTRL